TYRSRSRPLSSAIATSPLRFMTMSEPSLRFTVLRLWKCTVPAWRFSMVDASARRVAAPPMWKVRMVSCVPGSPIDCAAITPTAQDALAHRLDELAAFHQRAERNAVHGAAVVLGDDGVLRHVDEATGQVPGVGRLQRRVGEALAGAVRGDEVLQHGEAFTEVR